jgi:hypothetical protein
MPTRHITDGSNPGVTLSYDLALVRRRPSATVPRPREHLEPANLASRCEIVIWHRHSIGAVGKRSKQTQASAPPALGGVGTPLTDLRNWFHNQQPRSDRQPSQGCRFCHRRPRNWGHFGRRYPRLGRQFSTPIHIMVVGGFQFMAALVTTAGVCMGSHLSFPAHQTSGCGFTAFPDRTLPRTAMGSNQSFMLAQ